MTGLTPVFRVFCQSCTAPAIEPWSVRLTAGISSSAARETRSGIRHAPSRIEYSEWTCRWTKSAAAIAEGSWYARLRRAPESARTDSLQPSLGALFSFDLAPADDRVAAVRVAHPRFVGPVVVGPHE